MQKRCRWPAISILVAVILGCAIYFLLYRLVLLHSVEYSRRYTPVSSGQTSREIKNTARLIDPTKASISDKKNLQTKSPLMKTEREEFGNRIVRDPSLKTGNVKKENVVKIESKEFGNLPENVSSPKKGYGSVRNVMKENAGNTENKKSGNLLESASSPKKGYSSVRNVMKENVANTENKKSGNLVEKASSPEKGNGVVRNVMKEIGVNVTSRNESGSVAFRIKKFPRPFDKNWTHGQTEVPKVQPRVKLPNTSRETSKKEEKTQTNNHRTLRKFPRTLHARQTENMTSPLSHKRVSDLQRNDTKPTFHSVLSARKATLQSETKRSDTNYSKTDFFKFSLDLDPKQVTKQKKNSSVTEFSKFIFYGDSSKEKTQQKKNSSGTDFSKLNVERNTRKETKLQKKNSSETDYSKFTLDRDPRNERKQQKKNSSGADFSKFNFDRDRKEAEFAITLSPSSLIIQNPNLCSDIKETLWVILVHTAISHFSRRQAIRDTWANKYTFKHISLKLVFLVGTTSHALHSEIIVTESQQYGDIVQGNFLDSYRNLSTKGIMGFQWVATYCPMADLVIKVDDDVYLNMYKVIQHVFPRLQHKKRHMLCELNVGFPIHRNTHDAWYVSGKEFPHFTHYPPFCRGPAIFITPDLILPLLEAARRVPLFWIDDVYLYGMLPLEATRVKLLDFKANCSNLEKSCLKEYESDLPTNLSVCKATSKDVMYRMWRHGWRRLPENSRHLLSVNFLPVVDNFVRNFPKLQKYKFS